MTRLDFFSLLLITFFAPFFISFSYSYPSFEDCSPYVCNNSIIKFPFGQCNAIPNIDCPNNQTILLRQYDIRGFCLNDTFRVMGGITESSYESRTIRVSCNFAFDEACSGNNLDIMSINGDDFHGIFYLSDKYKWGTILTCETEPSYRNNLQSIKCLECRGKQELCYFIPSSLNLLTDDGNCRKYGAVIPADKSYNISDENNLRQLLRTGFEIKWNSSNGCHSCEASRGRCYSSFSTAFRSCICPDGVHEYNCSDGEPLIFNKNWMTPRYKPVIGVLSGVLTTVMIIIIYVRINRNKRQRQEEDRDIRGYMDPLDTRPPSVENFLHGGSPTRYSYRQIRKYTNNFADKLGQGGFGTVFKGKLPNGCMVAVKILDKSKHSRKQFINEVATIGRIHHLHLVRLLGYCFKGSKRALIYEYMVNGSLEKYIHQNDQNILDWNQLYSIAVGTARGIAYLHDDCRSKILHCDIKPHNILLDANFSPKVADFGLAKLTDRKESHVSLTGPRGTPGYVAPEMWSKNYGPVSDKSDVYSYGILVMEMVGGRKNFDMKETRSSKFYYPEWAFKQVEIGEFRMLREGNIGEDEDEVMAKKLSLVGLWCIQYSPSERPSMSRVIHMLEGTLNITIPPQPFPADTLVQTEAFTETSSLGM